MANKSRGGKQCARQTISVSKTFTHTHTDRPVFTNLSAVVSASPSPSATATAAATARGQPQISPETHPNQPHAFYEHKNQSRFLFRV